MKADNRYISYLDGCRGYAIILVIISHLHLAKMNVAYLGVTLFFFVSGFLITKLLIHEYGRYNQIKIKEFYIRRLFRLYPALIFMILLSITVLVINNYKIIWPDIFSGLFYFTNYYLVYFNPAIPDENYLLVSRILWSLSVEEHFYLIFPLLFASLYSLTNKRLVNLLSWLLLAFLLARVFVYLQGYDSTKTFIITYYTTHCRADSILFGCIAALLIYASESTTYVSILKSPFSLIAGFLLIAVSLLYTDDWFRTTLKYSFQGLGFFLVIPGLAYLKRGNVILKVVDNPVAVFVGKLSYSLYLFHWVALKISNIYLEENSKDWYFLILSLTIALSTISYYFVELPFVAFRRKYGSNAHK